MRRSPETGRSSCLGLLFDGEICSADLRMRKFLQALHRRVGVGGWIALFLLLAIALALPSILRSEFVAQRRAALALKQAQAHVASRDFDKARAEFRHALRLEPSDAGARRALAGMEMGQGNVETAFLEYESLTAMHPEDAGGWTKLAELMAKSGQLEAPEALLDKAIELDPHDAAPRLLRGDIRLRLGRYFGALQDARAAVAAAPEDEAARVLLVRATARSQGSEAGIEAAKQAVTKLGERPVLVGLLAGIQRSELGAAELGPPPAPPRRLRPDAHTGRGSLGAWVREHWPGRLAEIRQALEEPLGKQDWAAAQGVVDSGAVVSPGSAFAPFLAGTLELARGDFEVAEHKFTEALAIAPRLPAIVAALGRTWSLKKNAAFTGQQLMMLAERDPGFSLARYMAARAYIEARDPLRAEAALRRGLLLQPDSPVPYQQLTDYYFGLDRAAEALETCRRGLELFPDDIGLRMMLAQIDSATGQTRETIGVYEGLVARDPAIDFAQYRLALALTTETADASRRRFLDLLRELQGDMPSDPQLLDALGWMNYQAHDTTRARALLEAAVKGAPEEPSLHYHLAMVYLQDNALPAARQELQLALDSPNPFAEKLDAVRRLREESTPPAAKGKVSVTSRPR